MSLTFNRLETCGRLGNQLWQIAGVVGTAGQLRVAPVIPETWSYRSVFSIPDEWYGDPTGVRDVTTVRSVRAHFSQRALPYLQSLQLWARYTKTVRSMFAPAPAAAGLLNEAWAPLAELPRPILAVHVRRGDVLRNPDGTINVLTAEWYRRAIHNVGPVGSVVCFSDDQPWCRENLDADLFYEGQVRAASGEFKTDLGNVISGTAESEGPVLDWVDMLLMSNCDAHVISNSSYSWWGAWLSSDLEPRYPGRWYGRRYVRDHNAGLMIPKGWVKVP